MITTRFQFILITLVIFYFIVIIRFLKKEQLLLKYSLLWLLGGVILALCAVFPSILKTVGGGGVHSDVNFLFFVLICILLLIDGSLTIIVSRLSNANRRLTQRIAIIETELARLKNEKK